MDANEICEQAAADLDAWIVEHDPDGELALLAQIDGYYADFCRSNK
jgi:hypothetical protein